MIVQYVRTVHVFEGQRREKGCEFFFKVWKKGDARILYIMREKGMRVWNKRNMLECVHTVVHVH